MTRSTAFRATLMCDCCTIGPTLIASPPAIWDGLLETARRLNSPPGCYGFIFTGRESGLFGTFFELAEMARARLFPEDLVPDIQNAGGRWALEFLRTCYTEGLTPRELPDWHYDQVHECFRSGHAAMLGDWPGYSDPTKAMKAA